jgi:hypothetical protein
MRDLRIKNKPCTRRLRIAKRLVQGPREKQKALRNTAMAVPVVRQLTKRDVSR